MTEVHYADDTRATYSYDPVGSRTLMHDWTGRYTYTYDERNALHRATNPAGKTVTYSYDETERGTGALIGQ